MKIELRQAHALDLATLHARLRRRFEHYADRLAPLPLRDSVRFEERAVRGRFRGTDGVLTLDDRSLTATVDLPLAARPLRARIEDLLRRELALAVDASAPV